MNGNLTERIENFNSINIDYITINLVFCFTSMYFKYYSSRGSKNPKQNEVGHYLET